MKMVKLFAKPGHWFKSGSEVLNENNERFTEREIATIYRKNGILLVRGIRICDGNPSETPKFCVKGQEYEDLVWCGLNEFNIIYE